MRKPEITLCFKGPIRILFGNSCYVRTLQTRATAKFGKDYFRTRYDYFGVSLLAITGVDKFERMEDFSKEASVHKWHRQMEDFHFLKKKKEKVSDHVVTAFAKYYV